MPYPSQIDLESIVAAAHKLVEAQGADRLSLRALADRLNVRAPSLYRYVKNKTELLRYVNELTLDKLFQALEPQLTASDSPYERMVKIAHAYRRFAHEHPRTYSMVYHHNDDAMRFDENRAEQGVVPVQQLIAKLSGDEHSLTAIRGALALIHGWVMLELSQQFRRGGDLDAAFDRAFRSYLDGWLR